MAPAPGAAAGANITSGETLTALGGAADRGKEPLREFILKHTDPRDRASFLAVTLKMRAPAERAAVTPPARADARSFLAVTLKMRAPAERAAVTDRDFGVIVPAFVTSELRRAFQIGFLLFLPFLVVYLVSANLLLALGMHMLSPTTVSLPFKLLLFVVADGWTLVIRGLWQSYS